jgi:regulator of sigma E protease
VSDVLRTLITIVLFFGILGLLVLIHEVGHFIVARLFRPRPPSSGLPAPGEVSATSGAVYTLNWLPIGGFVKLEGEDGDGPGTLARSWPKACRAGHPHRRGRVNLALAFVIFAGIA